MNKTILYIVKKDDSLKSISLKYNTPISEIIRLNPLSKHRLIEGQPLILNIEYKEDTKSLTEQRTTDIYNKNELYNLLNIYKDLITSSIFYKFAFDYLKNKFDIQFNKTINNKNLYDILNNVLIFPTLLDKKDDQELLNVQKEINKIAKSMKEKDNDYFSSIDKIIENIELFILKLYGHNYKEADEYYELFIKEFYKIKKEKTL